MTTDALAAARDLRSRCDWLAALEAATAASIDSPELEAERSDLMADAAWWLGRLQDCIDARERAYRLFDELGDRRRAGQCAVWLWEHHAIGARPAIAGGWLRRARRALQSEPDCVELGALLLREAEVAHGSGNLDHARDLAARVVDLAR